METHRPSRVLRLLALLAIILNVAFGYFYPFLPLGLEDMKTVSSRYPNLFTPAPYAFSIWGVIYLSWFLYGLYTLFPGQRRNPLHDRLCTLLILLNVLASAWIFAFAAGFISMSLLIIAVMGLTGALLYFRARQGTRSGRLLLPFSLFLGWILVAILANLTVALTAAGWRGGALGEEAWTMLLVGVTVLLGTLVGYRYRDFVVPLVVSWAAVAIGVKQRVASPSVAFAAYAAAALMVLVSIVAAVRSLRPPRRG
jgi:hypothetical protein